MFPAAYIDRHTADLFFVWHRLVGIPTINPPGAHYDAITAHRHGSAGETLTLIADDLPRAAWPPANDHRGGSLAIDARARGLLDAARPSTTIVRPHDVEITFDGAIADTDRLAAAVELAAHWSAAPTAPYR